MITCYLAIGSNLGCPQRQIRLAIQKLRMLPRTKLVKCASIYRSKSWGRQQQPDFYNTVVAITTTLPAPLLLKKCQEIENAQGRLRRLRWGSRTLDIDILLYGSLTSKTAKLTLPHPYLLRRDFMYVPLLEIAPNVTLPNNKLVYQGISKTSCHLLLVSKNYR